MTNLIIAFTIKPSGPGFGLEKIAKNPAGCRVFENAVDAASMASLRARLSLRESRALRPGEGIPVFHRI